METCGPQRSPKTLAIAWLSASKNGLCSVLAKFTSPDHPDIVTEYCGSTDSYIIDNIIVREKTESIVGKPNLKEVIIDGIIKFTFQGESGTREKWSILVEELDGKWYVIDGYR